MALLHKSGREELRMVKAVLFDFDGTLVDFVESDIASLKYIHGKTVTDTSPELFAERAISNMIKFHELAGRGAVDIKTMHHFRLLNTFKELGIPWNDKYVELYKTYLLERTKPYAGITALLSYLTEKVQLGILTNAYDPVMQKRRIKASGLLEFFQSVVITGEEPYSKPDPGAFLLASGRLGVKPGECVFAGDSPEYDVQGANAAGMHSVLLQRTERRILHEPEFCVRSVLELENLLKNLLKQ